MTITSKLTRGLSAAAAIGAIGIGSVIVAAPANAVEGTAGETVTTAVDIGAFGTPFVYVADTRATLTFTVGGGATFAPGQDTIPSEGYNPNTGRWSNISTTGGNFMGARDCVLSGDSTELTCTLNRVLPAGSSDTWTIQADWDWRYSPEVVIPAGAAPGTTYQVTASLDETDHDGTSHALSGSDTVTVSTETLAVESPVSGSTVDASGAVFEGTGRPGESVEITAADGNLIGSGTVGEDGTWSVVAGPFADGESTVTVSSGAESVDVAIVVVVDDETVPVIAPLAAGVGAAGLGIVGALGYRRHKANTAA